MPGTSRASVSASRRIGREGFDGSWVDVRVDTEESTDVQVAAVDRTKGHCKWPLSFSEWRKRRGSVSRGELGRLR